MKHGDNIPCPTHAKDLDIICYDCKEMICSVCLIYDHKSHHVDHVLHIRSCIDDKDKHSSLYFNKRMDMLLHKLKHLTNNQRSMDQAQQKASKHFKELIDMIRVLEINVVDQIRNEKMKNASTVQSVINELGRISAVLHYSAGERNIRHNVRPTQLNEWITSSTTPNELIDKVFPPPPPPHHRPNDDDDAASQPLTDHDLLMLINNHIKHIEATNYASPMAYRVDSIDQADMAKLKEQVKSSLKLIDSNQYSREYDGHVFVMSNDLQFSIISPISSRSIAPINDLFNRGLVTTSTVYARGNIYVFGADDSRYQTYSRFSLADQKWTHNNAIDNGVTGGNVISVCFDGNEHIYLVGGFSDGDNLKRVDRFNIVTQQFSHVGKLPMFIHGASTFYKDGNIIIVGGFHGDAIPHQTIRSFNVHTLMTQQMIDGMEFGEFILSSCFDGEDNVYIREEGVFYRINLTNKRRVHLPLPDTQIIYPIVYHPQLGAVLLFSKDKTFKYTPSSNSWVQINGAIGFVARTALMI
ncbi:hypothetical protein SAMD00019534_030690, partial [Acytostelium subglobosum LB1]|uniref:hypothetical protein n=1 Tax=Acytostelium subglobosum LB1 TaxID=1410327 RepID=UPI000644972E